jgi:hypothetical protein
MCVCVCVCVYMIKYVRLCVRARVRACALFLLWPFKTGWIASTVADRPWLKKERRVGKSITLNPILQASSAQLGAAITFKC